MSTEVGGMCSFAASFDGVMLRRDKKNGKPWLGNHGKPILNYVCLYLY